MQMQVCVCSRGLHITLGEIVKKLLRAYLVCKIILIS